MGRCGGRLTLVHRFQGLSALAEEAVKLAEKSEPVASGGEFAGLALGGAATRSSDLCP